MAQNPQPRRGRQNQAGGGQQAPRYVLRTNRQTPVFHDSKTNRWKIVGTNSVVKAADVIDTATGEPVGAARSRSRPTSTRPPSQQQPVPAPQPNGDGGGTPQEPAATPPATGDADASQQPPHDHDVRTEVDRGQQPKQPPGYPLASQGRNYDMTRLIWVLIIGAVVLFGGLFALQFIGGDEKQTAGAPPPAQTTPPPAPAPTVADKATEEIARLRAEIAELAKKVTSAPAPAYAPPPAPPPPEERSVMRGPTHPDRVKLVRGADGADKSPNRYSCQVPHPRTGQIISGWCDDRKR